MKICNYKEALIEFLEVSTGFHDRVELNYQRGIA